MPSASEVVFKKSPTISKHFDRDEMSVVIEESASRAFRESITPQCKQRYPGELSIIEPSVSTFLGETTLGDSNIVKEFTKHTEAANNTYEENDGVKTDDSVKLKTKMIKPDELIPKRVLQKTNSNDAPPIKRYPMLYKRAEHHTIAWQEHNIHLLQ